MSVITLSLVSGTFAKYTHAVTGSESVRAAKFAFNLKQDEGEDVELVGTQASDTATFDIFSYTDDGIYGNGVNGTEYIAPGTTGVFVLDVENMSEVDVSVSWEFTEINDDDIPVYYTIEGGDQRYSSVLTGGYTGGGTYRPLIGGEGVDSLATDLSGKTLQASDGTEANATKESFTMNWAWSFDSAGEGQTDADDTTIGADFENTPSILLTCKATVEQLN